MDDGWMMDQVSVCTKILNVLLLCHWCHTLNFISTWSCFNIYIIVLLRVRSARSGERDNSTIVYNLHTFIWSLQNSLFNTVKVRKVSEWKRTCYWCKVKESNQWWSIISILLQIWDLAPDDKCWIIHMLNCTRAELYECWVVRMLNCTSADSSRLTIQKAATCTLHPAHPIHSQQLSGAQKAAQWKPTHFQPRYCWGDGARQSSKRSYVGHSAPLVNTALSANTQPSLVTKTLGCHQVSIVSAIRVSKSDTRDN